MALINALDAVLPATTHTLICIWHINKAVMGKMRELIPAKLRAEAAKENRELGECEISREIDRIHALWQAVVGAKSKDDYEACLDELRSSTAPPELIRYLNRQWIPHSERFVSYWADQHLHLGQRASSRVEGAHAKLKLDDALARSSQGNVLTLVEACIAVVEDYTKLVRHALGVDRSHASITWQKEPFFSHIMRKVSGKAIDLVSAIDWEAVKIGGREPSDGYVFT